MHVYSQNKNVFTSYVCYNCSSNPIIAKLISSISQYWPIILKGKCLDDQFPEVLEEVSDPLLPSQFNEHNFFPGILGYREQKIDFFRK